MRTPGWSRSSPQDAGGDRARRAATPWQPGDHEASPAHVEARKAQALARIWQELNEPHPPGREQQGSDASRLQHAPADNARGIRSLFEEMQKDPEVGGAIRADLIASLRKIAQAHVEREESDDDLKDSQQQLFGTDQYDDARSVTLRTLRERAESLSRGARQADFIARLHDAEHFLGELHLSQLHAAVVLAVTSPDRLGDGGAIVRNSVDVADSLEKLQEATRELSESAVAFQETIREVGTRVDAANEFSQSATKLREATRELSRSTDRLRIQLQRIVENRLVSDRGDPGGGFFLGIGEMIDTGPRLQQAAYDPGLQNAFESTGDLLTRSLLGIWQSSDARRPASVDSVEMAQ